jgi:hypothetical protein
MADRPFADPEAAARKFLKLANAVEQVQDGRIHIEKINWPFLTEHKGGVARVQRRPQARDNARVALDARERDLREDDASWCGPVRVSRLRCEDCGG